MNCSNNNNHKELITRIFCIIDDLLKIMKPRKLWNKSWRKSNLSISEVISINIFENYYDIQNWNEYTIIWRITFLNFLKCQVIKAL
jgi:hypothetical protein